MILRQLLSDSESLLKGYSSTPRLDAEILLAHVLQKNREFLYTEPNFLLSMELIKHMRSLTQERRAGKPIAYLIGYKEFYSLPFKVTPDTLIPRPETEEIVDYLLTKYDAQARYSLLDLGTGSGAIAISIAHHRPNWAITATDIHPETISVASDNAQQLKQSTLRFVISDWFHALKDQVFDIIVSNPPYISNDDPCLNHLRCEPQSALVSCENGFFDLKQIISQAIHYLSPDGTLLLEHGATQGKLVRTQMAHAGFHSIATHQDLAGFDRWTTGSISVR